MGALAQIRNVPESEFALTLNHEFSAGFEKYYFLQSDVHWDAPDWLRHTYGEHLGIASELQAGIIDNGDLFDVISSRGDKRGTKETARAEHATRDDYIDAVLEDAVQYYKPYADRVSYLGRGNHDATVRKMCGSDITKRFSAELGRYRNPDLPQIHQAGYGGWIKFSFAHASGGKEHCVKMKLFHGVGGGGEVTKGAMTAQRMMATIGNAEIVVTGHIHESWRMSLVQEHLADNGQVQLRERKHVQLGAYKADYRVDGAPSWHMMRPGGTPKPVGGTLLRFYVPRGSTRVEFEFRDLPVDYRNLS